MRKIEERKETTEQIHGGDIYRHPEATDFSVNSNPLGPPKGVIQALEESHWGKSPAIRICAVEAAGGHRAV